MRMLVLVFLVAWSMPACLAQDASPEAARSGAVDAGARFEELATRYKTLQDQFYAHKPEAGEDGAKRFIEKHPVNSMVNDFLSLEQETRGTQTGFSCLYHLVLAAGGVNDGDLPAARGKVAALGLLGQHYADYPDIDTLFRYLFSGPRTPGSKKLLRDLIESSRHEHVRANAMYELANYLALEANLPGMCESQLAVMDRTDPQNEARAKSLEKFTAGLKDVDIDRNREEATALIDELQKKYPLEPVSPRVGVRPPAVIQVERGEFDSVLQAKRALILDQLPAVRFELEHSLGQKAPAIDGKDAKGVPMSLSDFHGKVVVLMFSFKGCGPCEAMYPDNRQLIEELSEQPFAFVGVQADEELDTVLESLETGTITWRVWWEGKDKSISNRWNVRGWPSTFVLDRAGVIRYRDLRGAELANAVRRLLKEGEE